MSDLLKLKSIFSPTAGDTKFQDNQSNLSNFPRQFDNDFQQSNLQNLDSEFNDNLKPLFSTPNKSTQNIDTLKSSNLGILRSISTDDLRNKINDYSSNLVDNVGNTNLNYNENSEIPQTHGLDVSMETRGGRISPVLDSLLRGRIYQPVRFSQDFQNNSLFVKPEEGEIVAELYKTQTFDPRASEPKAGTLYFNTGNTFSQATNPTDFSTAGKLGIPYSRLDNLGDSPLDGMSWSKLYTADHRPKDYDEINHQGIKPIIYPNVNRDKLDIRKNESGRISSFGRTSVTSIVADILDGVGFETYGLSDGLRDVGQEPYMISRMPKSLTDHQSGRTFNFANYGIPVMPQVMDTLRITKFLTSPAGVWHITRQNLLGINQSPNRDTIQLDGSGRESGGNKRHSANSWGTKSLSSYKQSYNPLSSIAATGLRAGRGGPVSLLGINDPPIFSFLNQNEYPNFNPDDDIIGEVHGGTSVAPQSQKGSPLGRIVSSNAALANTGGASPINFASNLTRTDRSPYRGNIYYPEVDGGYPSVVAGIRSKKAGSIKDSPLTTLRNGKIPGNITQRGLNLGKEGTITKAVMNFNPASYGTDYGPLYDFNNTFNPKGYADDEWRRRERDENGNPQDPYNTGGDIHTLMQFGFKDNEVSTRLGRNQFLEKLEDAHPNDSKNGKINGSKNGMPFYFKDMRDGAFVFFRAFLEGINESITPQWTPHNYIGRSEAVHVYEYAERELNFTLKLFAQTREELTAIYEKLNKLTSFCYPEYYNDNVKDKVVMTESEYSARQASGDMPEVKQFSYGNRMKPPLLKLRMGELYGKTDKEQLGFLKSVVYDIEQESPWNTMGQARVPMYIVVGITYQIIHEKVPQMGTKFYGYTGNGKMAGQFTPVEGAEIDDNIEIIPDKPPQAITKDTPPGTVVPGERDIFGDVMLNGNYEDAPEIVHGIGDFVDDYIPEGIQDAGRSIAKGVEYYTGIDINPFDDGEFLFWSW